MIDWTKLVDYGVNLGLGGLLVSAGRWLAKRLDLPIITLQLENERLRGELKRLGEKYDNLEARSVAVAVRVKQDSTVSDELIDDLPSKVINRAELIAKKPPSLPPETKKALRDYVDDD